MTYDVQLSALAIEDLIALHQWLGVEADIPAADGYLARIEERIAAMADFPNRGSSRDDLVAGLRTLTFESRLLIPIRWTGRLSPFSASSTRFATWRRFFKTPKMHSGQPLLPSTHSGRPTVNFRCSGADEVDGSRSRHLSAKMGLLSCNPSKEPPAMEISTIGLDLAKNVFQVHGISATGKIVIRKALRRSQMLPFFEKLPPCLIGAEACGTSHHWARELTRLGHEVRLMPAVYVKPYVKRGKNDAADAEAICEAVTRQTMRFVPIKSREQQAALSLHRARSLLIKQRTQLVNMMRSVLAELGIAIPVGIVKALQMARQIVDGESELDLPAEAANVVGILAGQLLQLHVQLRKLDLRLAALQRSDDRARRLATIPGIGPIGATALAASVTDPGQFSSGRQFAAWLGLTPRQSSSGGKERLGRITKMGDRYLRALLVVGATALVRYAKQKPEAVDPRFVALLARKPARVASVAIANKMARIAWAVMARGGVFERGHAPMLAAA